MVYSCNGIYLAVKSNELLIYAKTKLNLKIITVSEISQNDNKNKGVNATRFYTLEFIQGSGKQKLTYSDVEWGQGTWQEEGISKEHEEIFRGDDMLILIVVVFLEVYTYAKIYQT